MRLDVALRSPLAFRLPGMLTLEAIKAPPDTVGILFEGSLFVWHPPVNRDDGLGHTEYGPMVSVVYQSEEQRLPVAESLQRFMSVVSFNYEKPVEDVHYSGLGGSGENDPFNPSGARDQKAYLTTYKEVAPAALEVEVVDASIDVLWLALASYREGMNAGSPFYKCLAFRNVLDAVFEVRRETVDKAVTAEAAARDAFIVAAATTLAQLTSRATPTKGWADYFRDEVRNALSHIIRDGGKVQVNPDNPTDRQRLRNDAPILAQLAHRAIETRWPDAVRAVPRSD